MACAQMKAVLDATGSLWQKGGLVGKPGGCFFSTASQASGQETTALTFVTQIVHHGSEFIYLFYFKKLTISRRRQNT